MTPRSDYAIDGTDGVHVKQSDARDDITALRARIAEYEARYQADLVQFLAYDKRIAELEAWIIEASSAYRLDGGRDTLEEALSLVRMCHEGRAAIDREVELEAALKEYANPDNWDNANIGRMSIWYGTEGDGYEFARRALNHEENRQ